MVAELFSFFQSSSPRNGDWTSQEIAEFYRVEAALVQAGLSLSVDRGLTDEGDPWFVFCRSVDGEVIVHFARIGGLYLVAAESVGKPISGSNFRDVLDQFVSLHPTLIPIRKGSASKILLHPASLLAAVVATALFQMSSSDAVANTIDPQATDSKEHSPSSYHHQSQADTADVGSTWSEWQVAAAVAAMIALAVHEYISVEHVSNTVAIAPMDTSLDHLVLSHSVVAHAPAVTDFQLEFSTASILDVAKGGLADTQVLQTSGSIVTQFWSNAQVTKPDGSLGHFTLSSSDDHSIGQFLGSNDVLAPVKLGWWASIDPAGHIDDVFANSSGVTPVVVTAAVPSKTTDTAQHANASNGVSDHVGSSVTPTVDSQSPFSFLNDQIAASNKETNQVNLTGSLSVQDVINVGLNDVLGNNVPLSVRDAVDHEAANNVSTVSVTTTSPAQANVTTSVGAQPEATAAIAVSTGVPPVVDTFKTFDATASKLLSAFISTNSFETLVSDHAMVFFDTNASHFSSPDLVVETWSIGGGYTISIVGQLPHDLAALA